MRTLGDPWRPPRPPPSDCVVMVPGTVSYYSRSRSGGVLKGAGDGEVGLLACGGCARRGKRQRSDAICAPCGVVIAWTNFDKAESPSNILDWLKAVYPNQEDRPSYICIDKACQVVRTALQKKRVWNEWKQTTRFIVDSYHYINHKADDFLCQKWCNPTPKDGSAPNLIGQKVGKDGKIYDVSLELYIYL